MGSFRRAMAEWGDRLKIHPEGEQRHELEDIVNLVDPMTSMGDELSDILYDYTQGGTRAAMEEALWAIQREQAHRIEQLLARIPPDPPRPGSVVIEPPVAKESPEPIFKWRYNPAPEGIAWDAMPVTLEDGSTNIPPGSYQMYLDRANHRWIARPFDG